MNAPEQKPPAPVVAAPAPNDTGAPTLSSVWKILYWPAAARSALFIVALPTLVATIYFGLLASDIYISDTRYAIRTSAPVQSMDLLSGLLSPSGVSPASEDSKIVRDYILSRDMLKILESRLNLRAHYSSPNVDFIARLPSDASEEDFLEYYRDMVSVEMESNSDISLLRIRAYSPRSAQRIAEEIIDVSERLINQWSERITEDTLRFARKELDHAEDNVRRASVAVTKFRSESRSVDPGEETTAVLSIITTLEGTLAAAKAELLDAQTFMRGDSIKVKQLKGRISALSRQIELERTRLAGESGSDDLTRLISGYQPLVLDQTLAEQRYASTLSSLELSRAEAQRQQRYLIPFVTPALPEEALEPKRLLSILTVFVSSLLIFGIGSLTLAAISEHTGL